MAKLALADIWMARYYVTYYKVWRWPKVTIGSHSCKKAYAYGRAINRSKSVVSDF